QPQGTDAYELRITLLRQLGREGEVLTWLAEAGKRDPHNRSLKLLQAQQYVKAGQAEVAERFYQELAADSAPGPEIYRGLFALYQEQGPTGAQKVLRLLDETVGRARGEEGQAGNAGEAARARMMLLVLRDSPELVKAVLPLAQNQLRTGARLREATRLFLGV